MPSVWVTSEADRPSPAGRPLHIFPGAGVGGLRASPFTSRPQETLSPCRARPSPVTPHQEAALTPGTRAADQQRGVPGTPPTPALRPVAPAADAAGRARNEKPWARWFPLDADKDSTNNRKEGFILTVGEGSLHVCRCPENYLDIPWLTWRGGRTGTQADWTQRWGGPEGPLVTGQTQEGEVEAGAGEPRGQL